jgi:HSP20 family protein
MENTATKLPVKNEDKSEKKPVPQEWWPFDSLRREVEQLFDDFGHRAWRFPFHRSLLDFEPMRRQGLAVNPAVDVAETDKAYEVTAELPGMDEKAIEVKIGNGGLTIRGEKTEESEKKDKGSYLSERRYGSFERYFRLPDSVDPDKIEASFNKGVLTVTLPKKAEAQKAEKKIEVKAA